MLIFIFWLRTGARGLCIALHAHKCGASGVKVFGLTCRSANAYSFSIIHRSCCAGYFRRCFLLGNELASISGLFACPSSLSKPRTRMQRRSIIGALLLLSLSLIDPQFVSADDKPDKPVTVKSSSIVATAGEANLANGNGDVSPSGLKIAANFLTQGIIPGSRMSCTSDAHICTQGHVLPMSRRSARTSVPARAGCRPA